jgi:mevalonate kinase
MKMQRYYSNGKLLLSGEYLILDGALGLALPTSYGQTMEILPNSGHLLTWESLNEAKQTWLKVEFNINNLTISSFEGDHNIAKTLQNILQKAKFLNSEFLKAAKGYRVKTQLNFPRNWGLGTSSTLINNIAQWANIDAYQLLFDSFGGSGYDIACAKSNSAITYRLKNGIPLSTAVKFDPPFKDQLYFVHLNKKQISKDSIKEYQKDKAVNSQYVQSITNITQRMLHCDSLRVFNHLLEEHESLVSEVLKKLPVQELLFRDFAGQTKSLGAWGGDFILATGDSNVPDYFKQKGFETVIPYSQMIKTK